MTFTMDWPPARKRIIFQHLSKQYGTKFVGIKLLKFHYYIDRAKSSPSALSLNVIDLGNNLISKDRKLTKRISYPETRHRKW